MAGTICAVEEHQALFIIIFTIVLAGATIYLGYATKKLWTTTKGMVSVSIMLEANRDLFFNDRMNKVRKAIESEQPIFDSNGGTCTEQDVEDYIGYFEMLHGFTEQRILDSKIMENNFGGYVEEAYRNKDIREYIADLRREMNDEELYSGFEKWGKRKLPKS